MTLGHEAVGRIVAVGDGVSAGRLGERVVLEPNIPCGTCEFCRRGRGVICPEKQVLGINANGAYADYVAIAASHAWTVPEELDWRDALLIEPLAVAVHALAVSGLVPGDEAIVLGCGPEGLLLTALLAAANIRVTAFDLNPVRVVVARELGAAGHVMTPDVGRQFADDLHRSGRPQTIFECSGSVAGTQWCVDAAPRGGAVVMVGLAERPVALQPLRYVREGISLVGSLIYDHPTDFRRAVNLVTGGLRLGHLIDQTFPLERIQEGLEAAAAGRLIKGGVALS